MHVKSRYHGNQGPRRENLARPHKVTISLTGRALRSRYILWYHCYGTCFIRFVFCLALFTFRFFFSSFSSTLLPPSGLSSCLPITPQTSFFAYYIYLYIYTYITSPCAFFLFFFLVKLIQDIIIESRR